MALTIPEYIKLNEERLKKLAEGKPMGIAVATTHAAQVKRIYTKGKDSQDSKIGSYNSSDPLYVNPKKSPKGFQVAGKTGETAFSDGSPHKTRWFPSYKAFRQQIGRETAFVNLRLSGQEQLDFSNSLIAVTPLKWTSGFKSDINADKSTGHERKYGKIFNLTKGEEELFTKTLQFETIKLLS